MRLRELEPGQAFQFVGEHKTYRWMHGRRFVGVVRGSPLPVPGSPALGLRSEDGD